MFTRITIIGSERGVSATKEISPWSNQSAPVDGRSSVLVALLRCRRALELDNSFKPVAAGRESRFRFFSSPFAGLVLGFIALFLTGPLSAETTGGTKLASKHAANSASGLERAIFAGGCFWCVQPPFEKLPGVSKVTAGYSGGTGRNPTYEDYAETGHVEVVEIVYDPSLISYPQLLDVLWRQIDPTDGGGQFVDRGPQYRSVIYFLNDAQKMQAEQSRNALGHSGRYDRPIATGILPATKFYPAEDYHQDYHQKNPIRYKYYRSRSGRDDYLDKIWGKDRLIQPAGAAASIQPKSYSPEELKTKLTPIQFAVTQRAATEPPFKNEYWNNERSGIYTDIVSGEPLYSSLDKFDSGTGWPSFTKPLEPGNIVEKEDRGFFTTRTEVRSKQGNSHLGHVFSDGLRPTGLRYCMNSAALHFIPKEELQQAGYGQYLKLFESRSH